MPRTSYTIKGERLRTGFFPGFEQKGEIFCKSADTQVAHAYFLPIDSGNADAEWGRLKIDLACSEGMIVYLYAVALNEDSFFRHQELTKIADFLCDANEDDEVKKSFFVRVDAKRFVNQKDVLLYTLSGRYLYLMLEVVGFGRCSFGQVSIDAQGDNFMNTFPTVYRGRDSFFHRFLSAFSSMYNDFEGDIEKLPDLLDLDTCPASLLPVYASWMGIDVGNNFLGEDILRPLVKQAYQLNRIKGTKVALERVAQLVLGERVQVVERNMMEEFIGGEQVAEFTRLYGDSVYDVTVLVEKQMSQTQKAQLNFLLNQFKPIRTRLHVIQLKKNGVLDEHYYLDMNATIEGGKPGVLDENQELDSAVVLKE